MTADTLDLPRAAPAAARERAAAVPKVIAAVPIVVILAVQTVLTARMLHTYPASSDESLYIYSGHQLIRELWNGGGSPFYETWFSGAPDLYPVLAAVLDHFGGLYLVREASMTFMVTASWLLYAATRRMFGYWPAVTGRGPRPTMAGASTRSLDHAFS